MRKKFVAFFFLVAFLVLVIDQGTKYIALHNFAGYPQTFFDGLIEFGFHLNNGIAFSIPAPSWLTFFLLPVGVVLLLWHFKNKFSPETILFFWAFVLLFTGGASNIIDRMVYGGVIDFIGIPYSVVNIADITIICGAILLLIGELYYPKTTTK